MIDIIIVFSYLFIVLVFGVWIGKGVGSSNDFLTGGRKYPAWVVFATLSSAFIGGGFTQGIAEKTYLYGLIYVITIFGFSLKEVCVAFFIAPKMVAFPNVVTVGEIMNIAFGKRAKVMTGIASVLVCGGIIGAQIAACGSIIHTLLGPPPMIGALLAASIVIIYATLGGMRSVLAVDILHFFVFAAIFPIVLIFGIYEIGGFNVFFEHVVNHVHASTEIINPETFILLCLSFFLAETLVPPYIQRLFIGKTVEETKKGTLWSGLFSIFFLTLMGCFGIVAFVLDPNLLASSALPHVIQVAMPIGLKGLAIAALLAAIMSSTDSFLSSIAIAFSQDILVPLGLMNKRKDRELLVTRLVTALIGLISIVVSLNLSCSIDILFYSYQFWTPFILTPLVAAIYGIRSSEKAFMISTSAGVMGVILWNLLVPHHLQSGMAGGIEGTIFGIILNTITFSLYHSKFVRNNLMANDLL